MGKKEKFNQAQFHKYLRLVVKPAAENWQQGTHDADLVCRNKDRIYFFGCWEFLFFIKKGEELNEH